MEGIKLILCILYASTKCLNRWVRFLRAHPFFMSHIKHKWTLLLIVFILSSCLSSKFIQEVYYIEVVYDNTEVDTVIYKGRRNCEFFMIQHCELKGCRFDLVVASPEVSFRKVYTIETNIVSFRLL